MDLPLDRQAVEKLAGAGGLDLRLRLRKAANPQGLPNNVGRWIVAARPRTLALSISPVCVGAAVAYANAAAMRWPAVIAALIGSVLIQIGTNLHNDAADCEKGGDGPDRVGPLRVTSSGLLSIGAVKRGAVLSFAMAGLVGIYLAAFGGWPILLLGLASIGAGWAYTGGPKPIAYTPFGELVVIAFFGVGAVCGTVWLAGGTVNAAAVEAGLMLGTLAGAVLLTNNHRDTVEDQRGGRRTLAILAGPHWTAAIYAALVLSPFAMLPLLQAGIARGMVWPPLFALPVALKLVRDFATEPPGRGFNRILVRTVQLQVLFGALLCVGLIA